MQILRSSSPTMQVTSEDCLSQTIFSGQQRNLTDIPSLASHSGRFGASPAFPKHFGGDKQILKVDIDNNWWSIRSLLHLPHPDSVRHYIQPPICDQTTKIRDELFAAAQQQILMQKSFWNYRRRCPFVIYLLSPNLVAVQSLCPTVGKQWPQYLFA